MLSLEAKKLGLGFDIRGLGLGLVASLTSNIL
jgi:hypothetical protein